MKRLCILTPCHWTGSYGGAEQQILLLLDVLISQNKFDITYLTRHVDPVFQPQGYKIEKINYRPVTMRLGNILDTPQILRRLSRIQPHVIYQRVGGAYTGIAAYYARRNDCRMVWHVSSDVNVLPIGLDKNKSSNVLSRYIEKKVLEYGIHNCSDIIAQTRYQANALDKYYGARPANIISNYQPVASISEKQERSIQVVWISNLKPMKRPELFIQLARKMNSYTELQFTMIGRSSNSEWCNQIIKSLSDIRSLKYLGEQSQDDVNQILSEAHILVNTSSYEGFPNTFIQAWMRKVPVVSLEVNPDEVLTSSSIGFCSGSFENLCRDVERLVNDGNLRKMMGENARNYAIENHSEKNIDEIIKVIDA